MGDRRTDLELAVSITNTNQLKNSSDIGGGADANANSNSNAHKMQFVRSDRLAELVWSPQTGLNIKFADERPCSGPTDIPVSENRLVGGTGSQNRGAAYEDIFEYGMTSGNGSCSGSKPHLKVEPMMQCRPDEQAEREDSCFGETFLENAQVALLDNIIAENQSCRGANFLTTRKRECNFEQQLILGDKRIKTESNSSFMNWISNTLKGSKKDTTYDPRVGVFNKGRGLETKTLGFHNVFHSLFSPETIKRIGNKPVGSLEETVLPERCSHESLNYVKQKRIYEQVTKEAPKEMFDTIRKLRLSRTHILKWMSSGSLVAQLDGFFLRIRVAKWEEGAGGSKYYVARITGIERENPGKDSKQSIRVKVGDVECFVQSQYISNCDFLDDELTAWWQETTKNGGIPVVESLESKLAERKRLGM